MVVGRIVVSKVPKLSLLVAKTDVPRQPPGFALTIPQLVSVDYHLMLNFELYNLNFNYNYNYVIE